jgi:hypothetical protein
LTHAKLYSDQKFSINMSFKAFYGGETYKAMHISQIIKVGFFFFLFSFLSLKFVLGETIKVVLPFILSCNYDSFFYWFFFVLNCFFFNFIHLILILILFYFYIKYDTHSLKCFFLSFSWFFLLILSLNIFFFQIESSFF